jgi:hypothetical protein
VSWRGLLGPLGWVAARWVAAARLAADPIGHACRHGPGGSLGRGGPGQLRQIVWAGGEWVLGFTGSRRTSWAGAGLGWGAARWAAAHLWGGRRDGWAEARPVGGRRHRRAPGWVACGPGFWGSLGLGGLAGLGQIHGLAVHEVAGPWAGAQRGGLRHTCGVAGTIGLSKTRGGQAPLAVCGQGGLRATWFWGLLGRGR